MLAVPMARDLQLPPAMVYAAFSVALIISAILGPISGRCIDRRGGRPVLAATSVIAAAGLLILALAQGPVGLFVAWAVLGVAMGAGLYEAAFATVVRLHGSDSRRAMTGITLMAGFASTLGWPLTTWLEHAYGWRGACAVWAGLHLVVGLPIHLRLSSPSPAGGTAPDAPPGATSTGPIPGSPRAPVITGLLSLAFAVTWFTSTAMAAHLPYLLQIIGLSLTAAIAAAALVGPAQVLARIVDFSLLSRTHPLSSARLASLAHPVGAVAVLVLGPPAGVLFTLLHGAGNGILTIAKGTLPLVLFGPSGYGARQGLLMVPARLAQAVAPFLFGLALERCGAGALWLTIGLGAVASSALFLIRATDVQSQAQH